MASPLCFPLSQISLKIDRSALVTRPSANQRSPFAFKYVNSIFHSRHVLALGSTRSKDCSFAGGLRITIRPNLRTFHLHRKSYGVHASWLANSQIASSVFTLGTAAVLPFYTLMVVAPKAELTKKSMESSIPYVVLGLLYAYLLYLSWTPDTLRQMFASQYWLPELPGIAKLFSSEMTLASAWIHLLAVDLFAARQVFLEGLENEIETRHSVSLCLFFCPIGIVTHVITKALSKSSRNAEQRLH